MLDKPRTHTNCATAQSLVNARLRKKCLTKNKAVVTTKEDNEANERIYRHDGK